jgi:hypothetical protein
VVPPDAVVPTVDFVPPVLPPPLAAVIPSEPVLPPPSAASLALDASLVLDEPSWPEVPPALDFPPVPASASEPLEVELPLEQPSAIPAIKIKYRRARMRESYHGFAFWGLLARERGKAP